MYPQGYPVDPASHEGWASACRLYEHLLRGGELLPLPQGTLRLRPGEQTIGDAICGYCRLYGMDLTYQQRNGFNLGSAGFAAAGLAFDAIRNNAARPETERLSAVRWRDYATLRTVLSTRRLLCDFQGSWLSFWHEGIIEFVADLPRWAFILRYEQIEPVLIHGPAAPWFAVALAYLIYGREGLNLACLAPLATAVANRRPPELGLDPPYPGADPQYPGTDPLDLGWDPAAGDPYWATAPLPDDKPGPF
jgi:hypothetical protein